MEVTYHKEGEYYLPDLIVPEAPKVGRYGMLRRRFLRENRNGTYTAMLLTGKLNQHLEEIDRQANEMMETLTAQMAKQEGVNESLKAENQMKEPMKAAVQLCDMAIRINAMRPEKRIRSRSHPRSRLGRIRD